MRLRRRARGGIVRHEMPCFQEVPPMLKGAAAALAALLVLPVAAAEPASPPDDAAVTATIAALAAGDVAEAEWLVTQVGSLQFPGLVMPDRKAALRTLAGCKAAEQSRGTAAEYTYVVFSWKCRGETYIGKLIPEKGGRTAALADFLTEAEYTQWARRIPRGPPPPPMMVPPPPVPLTPEALARKAARDAAEMAGKKELAGRFAEAVMMGDLSAFALRHPTYATTTYGFTDPVTKRDYVDRVWRGADDLASAGKMVAEAVAHARSELGAPVGWSCQDAFPYVECSWSFDDPGKRLTAELHVFRKDEPNWGISVFSLRYETAEKRAEAEARAAR
jgi:hypothetical protein